MLRFVRLHNVAFHRWFDHKYGTERQEHDWVKVHLMCGVRTNIVTAVEIRDRDAATRIASGAGRRDRRKFQMREVSGDKGYGSLNNHDAIARHGAVPFIAFKCIHDRKGGRTMDEDVSLFPVSPRRFSPATITSAAMSSPSSR